MCGCGVVVPPNGVYCVLGICEQCGGYGEFGIIVFGGVVLYWRDGGGVFGGVGWNCGGVVLCGNALGGTKPRVGSCVCMPIVFGGVGWGSML